MSERRLLWVVEMWLNRRWEPTTATGITKAEARQEATVMRQYNPGDKFRLSLYQARKPR